MDRAIVGQMRVAAGRSDRGKKSDLLTRGIKRVRQSYNAYKPYRIAEAAQESFTIDARQVSFRAKSACSSHFVIGKRVAISSD